MAARRRDAVLMLVLRGETAWEVDERLHGRTDLPLAEAGRNATAAAAAGLLTEAEVIHHAPDEASAETACIVAAAAGGAARARPDEALSPADLGVLEGLSTAEFAERFSRRHRQWQDDPMTLSPPEGEHVAAAMTRLYAAAARLLRRARGGEVGLVLPPLCLGLLRCHLAGRPSRDAWAMATGRPRIERYLLPERAIGRLEEAAIS